MASTVLAVDDSVTMRKILEITFAGPEFRVVTANGPDAALQKLRSERPDVVVTDLSLEPRNGYDLCRAIKQIAPGTPVLVLSSKHNPYDQAKGAAVHADDYMDKPFDTQQLIDKVKKLLVSRGERTSVVPVVAAGFRQSDLGAARARTLSYNPAPPTGQQGLAAKEPAAPLAPTPVTGVPLQPRKGTAPSPGVEIAGAPSPSPAHGPLAASAAGAPAAAAAGSASAVVNGAMAAKLDQLGLTPVQVEAVLALSRDVVERVVWEVVPVLAETIIKEEIARLTK